MSKKKNSTPTKFIYKNKEKTNNIEMAESLNDFFVNTGSSVESKIPKLKQHFVSYLGESNNKNIFLQPCSYTEILLIINEMKSSKASRPNSIATNLLMEFPRFLVYPLVVLINMSFEEGVFPSLNKEAGVCPIFKKFDRNKCENYRPISLLSNISKIFERVMYTRLENVLSEILYRFQFGFRKGFSTNHALAAL